MQKPLNFKLWNTLSGWMVFLISFIVYILTLEPTTSYWDCGEFLSCATNLEVSHPPGAPLFMLLGRIAAIIYPSNPTLMINGMSALASALTILFLFWTITWFGRKIYGINNNHSTLKDIGILVAGFIGSLSFAFTDSFWFSAVEAEVYASSSMLTALVFWCVLKWEESYESSASSERWLLLITYLFGLSVGIHMLNLLVIPALVMIYFFKRFPVTKVNILKALGVSVLLLAVFLIVVLKWVPKFLTYTELFAVNGLNLPYNSGFIFGVALVFVTPLIVYWRLNTKGKYFLARLFLYFWFVLAGISSYATIVIRSCDNPPVDMSNPEDPFAFENYLNREQYDQRPLFYGQSFLSPAVNSTERNSFQRSAGKYISYPLNPKLKYQENSETLFPRMSSNQEGHPEAYRFWTGDFHGRTIETQGGRTVLPSFGDNLRFFFQYQFGYMYFRYFMWNFAGKQNDIQGRGTATYGNWLSGFKWLDSARLGNQDKVPDWLKNNPGRNRYFMIPLILGIIGMCFHYQTDKKNFWVVTTFFILTGAALTIYLNEVPVTPRERDYVYVGSFYAFAIWIGIGMLAIFSWLSQRVNKVVSLSLATLLGLSVPIILIQQNYHDHDRSSRYGVLEYARNYLESCAPNAILFTNADNDTYPLWYAQEVKGIRRDVRLVLVPYLSAYWYVDQMRKPIYNSPGLKMKLGSAKYEAGKRTYLPIVEQIDSAEDINEVISFVASDDSRAMIGLQNGEKTNYFPVKKAFLRTNPIALKGDSSNSKVDSILFQYSSGYIRMDELVLLDIIASNNWERPIYFTSEQVPHSFGLEKYLKLDGYAYQLTPFENKVENRDDIGSINTEDLYNKFMKSFQFETLANKDVYLDYYHVYTVGTVGLRGKFTRLAEKLIAEGKSDKAEAVLDKITSMIPLSRVPFDYSATKIAGLYFTLNKKAKGEDLLKQISVYCSENLKYFTTLKNEGKSVISFDINLNMYLLQEVIKLSETYKISGIEELQNLWNVTAPVLLKQGEGY